MSMGMPPGGATRRTRGILLLVFLALTVVVITGAQWWMTAQATRALEHATALRLTTVVLAAVGEVTDELLLRDGVEDDTYVNDLLESVRERNGLLDVFVAEEDGVLVLDLSGNELLAGNPYLDPEDEAFTKAVAGVPGATPGRELAGAPFRTAYAPIRWPDDSVGRVLGVVGGAEFGAQRSELRHTLRVVSLASAVFVIFLGLLFFGMSRRLATAEAALVRSETLGAMGMMAAGVAHEVRNPLAIIAGTAQRLRKKYGTGVDDPLFEFIPEEVDRLNGILAGYLRFARDEPLRLVSTDLARVVDRATRLVGDEWEGRGVRFERTGGNDALDVAGDPQRLTQVLLNVLINAAQAMPEGGSVRVHVAREGADAVIRVSDSGPGFDERALRGAFQPFFTTKDKGSGLGLAMAKRILEGHCGTITVGNRPEGGAVVTLCVPVSAAGPKRRPAGD